MGHVTVSRENAMPVDPYYEDHGAGAPVVLIHGWPLSGASWEKQLAALLHAGHRVVTYDRRGFGRSSRPSTGYDYDTFAEDLHRLVTKLELDEFTPVGFSMGTGEVARYPGAYGSERVSPAAFLSRFLADFYNADELGGERVSDEVVHYSWAVAAGASGKGTLDCVRAWMIDFRDDVARIDVPALIVQGDADRILPIGSTGVPLSERIDGVRLVVVDPAPDVRGAVALAAHEGVHACRRRANPERFVGLPPDRA